jgi:hypothetical protein
MGEMSNPHEILVTNLKGRGNMGDLGLDVIVVINRSLKMGWEGLDWLL